MTTTSYEITDDGVEIMLKTVNIEGDTIDFGIIVTSILKEMRRLDGMWA